MKYVALVAMLVLAGCGANDPFLAKTVDSNKNQKADIERAHQSLRRSKCISRTHQLDRCTIRLFDLVAQYR